MVELSPNLSVRRWFHLIGGPGHLLRICLSSTTISEPLSAFFIISELSLARSFSVFFSCLVRLVMYGILFSTSV